MCGRFFWLCQQRAEIESAVEKCNWDVKVRFNNSTDPLIFSPRYNIAPTQSVPVLLSDGTVTTKYWGFHAGPIFIINARNEEIHTKHRFKDFLDSERCCVLASGYYEWRTVARSGETLTAKEPFAFRPGDNRPVCFIAGLRDPKEDAVVLLTREAPPKMAKIHTRMPVLLRADSVAEWLECKQPLSTLTASLIADEDYSGSRHGFKDSYTIESEPLAPHVNKVSNSGPECLQSLQHWKEQSYQKGIGRFFSKA
jgi:putative SOS response-associated peptidase YedK